MALIANNVAPISYGFHPDLHGFVKDFGWQNCLTDDWVILLNLSIHERNCVSSQSLIHGTANRSIEVLKLRTILCSFGNKQWQKLRTISSFIWHQTMANSSPSLHQNVCLFPTTISPIHRQNCVYFRANVSPGMNHKNGSLVYKFWILAMESSTHHFLTEFRLQAWSNTNAITGLLCQEWNTTFFLFWRWNLQKKIQEEYLTRPCG